MTMQVKVYQPDCQVTLYKTVKRNTLSADGPATSGRFQNLPDKIDLTPFLSESTGVTTTKSVREPAGAFSLSLADKAYGDSTASSFETLYGLIEPMDFIEIRMRHDSSSSTGQPPIVMRGFVSEVARQEAMGSDGRPMRVVSVSGQDYGKLWQQMRIMYWTGYVLGQDVLSNFKLFASFGAGFKTGQKGTDFLKEMIEKVFNPYLQNLIPKNSPNPNQIKTDDVSDSVHGIIDITGPQNRDGSIYELVSFYLDVGPWNELFLEDRDDGVYCVFRPNPFYDVANNEAIQDGPDVDLVDLPAADVISLSVARTDANVANFYWVRSPSFDLVSEVYRKQYALKNETTTVDLEAYINAQSSLYGTRLMNADTQMGGDDVTSFKSGQDKTAQATRDTSQANWINDRRRLLAEQNKDNVVFERGAIRVRGNEAIKAGTYVNLQRGSFSAEYYVVQVDHEYMPMRGFFSTLRVERGRGFIERAQREGGASTPYLAEYPDNTQ